MTPFTGGRADRCLRIVVIMHLLTGCFKITLSLRTYLDCSSCEMVSKKYMFLITAVRLTIMVAITGNYADLCILKSDKAGFR